MGVGVLLIDPPLQLSPVGVIIWLKFGSHYNIYWHLARFKDKGNNKKAPLTSEALM